MALKLVLQEQPETLLSPAVAVSVTPADGSNFKETFFSISDPSNVQVCVINGVSLPVGSWLFYSRCGGVICARSYSEDATY